MRSLIPWRAGKEGWLEGFRDEMDEAFRRFFGPVVDRAAGEPAVWAPRIDFEETEKEYVIKTDLPGVEPKDVEVFVTNGVLVFKGERKEEKEEKKKNYHKVERFFGSFYREVPLPPTAEAEKVNAAYAKGVVTVTIPKKAAAVPKKIPITPTE